MSHFICLISWNVPCEISVFHLKLFLIVWLQKFPAKMENEKEIRILSLYTPLPSIYSQIRGKKSSIPSFTFALSEKHISISGFNAPILCNSPLKKQICTSLNDRVTSAMQESVFRPSLSTSLTWLRERKEKRSCRFLAQLNHLNRPTCKAREQTLFTRVTIPEVL